MQTRRAKKPAYLLHKATGRARVRINGKDIYLGPYKSQESLDRYDALIREWLRANCESSESGITLTVDELAIAYIDFAEQYYRHPDGRMTTEVAALRSALRYLVQEFGPTRAKDFGPRSLVKVRDAMVNAGHCRKGINSLINRIRRAFAWGVANEYFPTEVCDALRKVTALKAGRSSAQESDPIRPVEKKVIDATLPHLPPVVQQMVRLQLLTGARPSEICMLRPCDIAIGANGIWTYRPTTHKTSYRGKERRIFIGPEGQEILRPLLNRPQDAYCFCPIDSEAVRRKTATENRKTPPGDGNRPGTNKKLNPQRTATERYTKDTYARAVARACEVAFDMPKDLRKINKDLTPDEQELQRQLASAWRRDHVWTPNQLRHSRATILREKYGIEAAQVVLGHSDSRVTEIYAERDFARAAEIMREIG